MANFKPDQNEYKNLTPFKMWLVNQINTWGCSNFPFLESDFDKLTNYAMMMKLMKAMNNVIANENKVEEDMTNLFNAFTELQNYINNYFDNLDIQEEINNKLDDMAQDGTLTYLIGNYVEPYITEQNIKINEIENKVNSATNGSPIPVDSINDMIDTNKIYVLTTDGYWYYYNSTNEQWEQGGIYQSSQDSDTLTYLKNKVDETLKKGTFNYVNQVEWENGAINPTTGVNTSSPLTAKRTPNFIDIPYSKLHITKSQTGYAFYLVRYNKLTHEFISSETMRSSVTDITYDLNENEVYKFCLNKNDQTTSDLNILTIEPHNTIFDELLKINQVEDKAIITFIDDDESINFYNNNKGVFDNYNMKCDCAIVTDWVGESNRMSLEQLQELQSQGFEIVCHSKTHDSKWQTPKTSSIESLKEDAQLSYNYMTNNNFNTNIFVYPYGSGAGWDTLGKHRISKIINQVGFNYGVRASGNNGINEKPLDNLSLNRMFIDKNNNLSTYTDIIDTAITNKQWIIFGLHSGNTSQIDSTYLNSLLNYINTLNTNETVIEVMTFSQALQYKRNVLSKGILNFEDYTYIDKDGKFYY